MSRVAGVILFVLGMSLRFWAMFHLRRAGVLDCERIQIPTFRVKSGPYRLCGHPMYLGSVMVLSGVGMIGLGWGGIVLGYTAVPVLRIRALSEDDLLKAANL